jgi:4-amino-4-deoxychorismate lyase
MSTDTAILVNGERNTAVHVFDRGFQYGDGVFETIAVYQGSPLLWEQHIERLTFGARRLNIPVPDPAVLRHEAEKLCDGNARAVLKLILTRGMSTRGYSPHTADHPTRVLIRSAWPDYPNSAFHEGVRVRICHTRLGHNPQLAGIKHLNRLEQVLARAEWGSEYAEGLMCDQEGFVIEGTMSNIFSVKNGVLRTPDVTRCGVEGVMRAMVLQAARKLQVPCEIGTLAVTELESATELFLTNSLIGVWPIRQLQDKDYIVGPITHTIQDAIRDAHCFNRY